MTRWNLAEAKIHLGEIIDQVHMGIPQEILSEGKIVCLTTYKKNKKIPPQLSFKEMLLSIPKSNNNEDDFERASGGARDIDL
jgi:hypothetical protein